ncbi:MAG: HAD-IA family hydrolase [bacterium]
MHKLFDNLTAVVFDMDGVLCDSEPFIAEAACRMFAECHGVTVLPAEFQPFIGTGENQFLGGVAAQHGVTMQMPADKSRTYAIYLEIIRGRLKPYAGALEFVNACRARGLKTAVATSADRVKLDGNLREIGLPESAFDAVVTGSEVANKKPAPDLFLAAAHKLGVMPACALVIEDAPMGVRAAKAAGMRCLGLTTSVDAAALRAAGADATASALGMVRIEI